MTSRRTTAGGHGGGNRAEAPSASRAAHVSRRSRLIAGGLAAATATGALVTFAGIAQAGNPPAGPGNIEIFAARDMVALEGYSAQAGQQATVTVKRGNTVIGTGRGTVDDTGFLEFNHPGGSCWDIVTPDIRGGDVVEARFSGAEFVDGAVTSSAVIPKVRDAETGAMVTATKEAPAGVVDGADWHWVKIAGRYDPAQVTSGVMSAERFVVEIVNPAMREPGSTVGERAIGWSPGPVDPAEASTTYTTTGEFNPDGTFAAYFGVQTETDRELALAGEHVAVSWMANGTGGEEVMLGTSLYEAGETNGPGFGGCPAGPGNQDGVAPTTAALTTASGTGDIKVSWTPPAQLPDANPIVGYRVSAVDASVTSHRQEVSVEVDGDASSATIVNLQQDQAYEIQIEVDNGQWSDPVTVGTATPGVTATTGSTGGTPGTGTGDGTGGTGGGTTDPGTGTPDAVPAAPASATATAAADGGVDVTWAAVAEATSYTVTATSATEGAATPAPVNVTTTSAKLTGLTPGTAYTVSVTANNATGPSATAATASVTTSAAVAPSAVRVTRTTPSHASIAVEWTAATPGNASSPVTGYDLVATPITPGGPSLPAVQVGAVTNGTITGLTNGTAYQVQVFARSGAALSTAPSTNGAGVAATVTPNDVVTVTRAQYRADKREYRIAGTAAAPGPNRVHIRTTTGAVVQINVPVAADGTWSVDLRNGPALPADNRIVVTSDAGASLTTLVTRSR